jgi:hypothetical protein
MKLDFELFQVLPDELNPSRKWVCCLSRDPYDGRVYRSERNVNNNDTRHDDLAKTLVMDEVFESFIHDYIKEVK